MHTCWGPITGLRALVEKKREMGGDLPMEVKHTASKMVVLFFFSGGGGYECEKYLNECYHIVINYSLKKRLRKRRERHM